MKKMGKSKLSESTIKWFCSHPSDEPRKADLIQLMSTSRKVSSGMPQASAFVPCSSTFLSMIFHKAFNGMLITFNNDTKLGKII